MTARDSKREDRVARRLPHNTYTPVEYARVLRSKHGAHADRLASNRYDDARTEAVAVFYDRVLDALSRDRSKAPPAETKPATWTPGCGEHCALPAACCGDRVWSK